VKIFNVGAKTNILYLNKAYCLPLSFNAMTLQILIDKEKTILSKNTLLALRGNSETIDKIPSYASNQVNFLLCPSCFWCASCLSPQMLSVMAATNGSGSFSKCPSCVDGDIEFIPIAKNENYRFDYDTKRGVTMEFFR
jgi:hypothetical protein